MTRATFCPERQDMISKMKQQIDAFKMFAKFNPNLSWTILIDNLEAIIAKTNEEHFKACPYQKESTTKVSEKTVQTKQSSKIVHFKDPDSSQNVYGKQNGKRKLNESKNKSPKKIKKSKTIGKVLSLKKVIQTNFNQNTPKQGKSKRCTNLAKEISQSNRKMRTRKLVEPSSNDSMSNDSTHSYNDDCSKDQLTQSGGSDEMEPVLQLMTQDQENEDDLPETVRISVNGHIVDIIELSDAECRALDALEAQHSTNSHQGSPMDESLSPKMDATDTPSANVEQILSEKLGDSYGDLTWKLVNSS